MRLRDALYPVSMQRVALMAPRERLRDLLVNVADQGSVELDDVPADPEGTGTTPAAARLRSLREDGPLEPVLAAASPDLDRCERGGRLDVIAGEAQLEQRAGQAVCHGRVAALAGWTPADAMPQLAARLAGVGGAVVPMARPRGAEPPTMLPQSAATREFAPLVNTYATVPYADVNPSAIAGVAYVVMFGMMFADAGQGALLLGAALAIRVGRLPRLGMLRPVWLFLAGAGVSSMVFGVLYGEFFGPTDVIPAIWLAPLDHPVTLLAAAVGVGALLLALAYVLGAINRFREGGWRLAVYAPTGIAGATIFLGLGLVAAAIYFGLVWLIVAAGLVTLAGLGLAFVGLLVAAGGGVAGAAQAAIEVFDLVLRIGSNLVSFARLAAFGLTHAALGLVIWQATTGLWQHGPLASVGAIVVFLVGNAVAFALEGLVAAIQALRLEYYELFSRIFDGEGRPFRPWHIPLDTTEAPC